MSSGTSDNPLTNKTEFQRYLDENPDAVASFSRRLIQFNAIPNKGQFGAWMRCRHLSEFTSAYKKWWLKNPQLFGVIYQQQDMLSVK